MKIKKIIDIVKQIIIVYTVGKQEKTEYYFR